MVVIGKKYYKIVVVAIKTNAQEEKELAFQGLPREF
jgi:hypothetical protein